MIKEIKEKIPIIETDYSYHWRCPECSEYQSIEKDGDGFYPVICQKCKVEFSDYEEE